MQAGTSHPLEMATRCIHLHHNRLSADEKRMDDFEEALCEVRMLMIHDQCQRRRVVCTFSAFCVMKGVLECQNTCVLRHISVITVLVERRAMLMLYTSEVPKHYCSLLLSVATRKLLLSITLSGTDEDWFLKKNCG